LDLVFVICSVDIINDNSSAFGSGSSSIRWTFYAATNCFYLS